MARREAEEKELATKIKRQVENEKDKMANPSTESSKPKDKTMTEPLAETPKAKDETMIETSTTSDDDVLKILESHLDGMEGRPDPLKKKTYKVEKRFKWVPKTKKVEPQGLEEVGDIMDEEVIEDQPIKDDDLIISASEKELKGKLKLGR